MIVGLALKYYKIYSKIKFVPLVEPSSNKLFTSYIGTNGSGKSTILEALDTYFNDKEFKYNNYAYQKGNHKNSYIAPIFLFKKDDFNHSDNDFLELLSNSFWELGNDNYSKSRGTIEKKEISEFIKKLNYNGYNNNNYYLFILSIYGKPNNNKYKVSTEPFNILKQDKDTQKKLFELYNNVKKSVKYIYIPVEPKVSETLSFEANEMQALISEDLGKEIDNILKKKIDIKGQRKTHKQGVILELINKELENFMKDIEEKIKEVDNTYKFSNNKKKLKATDIREKIIETYFYSKILKKGDNEIYYLSSGEQRKVLFDVVYSLLTKQGDKKKNIVFAIDEPESSMHLSSCLSQFERLFEISDTFQVMFTSHWYGFLPIMPSGQFYHLKLENKNQKKGNDKDISIYKFLFSEYLEEVESLTDDIELKSMFDLVSSIVNSLKSNPYYNWIICEGPDDKLYLETMLQNKKNTKILPLGGKDNVKKIYNFLQPSINLKPDNNLLKGKVLCLLDTDDNVDTIESSGNDEKDKAIIRRLQVVIKENDIKLFDLTNSQNNLHKKTNIEDCLIPELYYEAIKSFLEKNSERHLEIFYNFDFNENSKFSMIEGENSILKLKDLKGQDKKNELVEYIQKKENKYLIAKEYNNLFFGKKFNKPNYNFINSINSFLK